MADDPATADGEAAAATAPAAATAAAASPDAAAEVKREPAPLPGSPGGGDEDDEDDDAGPTQQQLDADEAKAAGIMRRIAEAGATVFFEKALTASDASGSGRVVVPKVLVPRGLSLAAAVGGPRGRVVWVLGGGTGGRRIGGEAQRRCAAAQGHTCSCTVGG